MNDRKEERILKELRSVRKWVRDMWSITNIKKVSGSVSQKEKDYHHYYKTHSVKTLQEIIRLIENDEI